MREDDFYKYLQLRETVRIKKEVLKEAPPWSDDYALNNFKFTNVKRINDRTTRHFANIYQEHARAPDREGLYNAALYRYFGTMGWADAVGWMNGHDIKWMHTRFHDLTHHAGENAFTGAYVITNGGRSEPKQEVVFSYLAQLWVDAPTVVAEIEATRKWEAGYELLRRLPGFGGSGFMAKEVLQDYLIWLGYRNDEYDMDPVEEYITDFWSFTPIGPGARRGLNRLAGRALGAPVRFSKLLAEVTALRSVVSPRFREEFGVRLSAHDIQFCLCEFDKYERLRLGEGQPKSRYYPRQEK